MVQYSVDTYMSKIERHSELVQEISCEFWIHVQNFLQIREHDFMKVAVGEGSHTVVGLAYGRPVLWSRFIYVFSKYVIFA